MTTCTSISKTHTVLQGLGCRHPAQQGSKPLQAIYTHILKHALSCKLARAGLARRHPAEQRHELRAVYEAQRLISCVLLIY
jgi:hypothetical protein